MYGEETCSKADIRSLTLQDVKFSVIEGKFRRVRVRNVKRDGI
jgi:hypothetical protein